MKMVENQEEKTRALNILESAFINVPGVVWMISNKRKTTQHLRILLSVCLEEALLKTGAYITSDSNGVILFYKLDAKPRSLILLIKKLYLLLKVTGIKHGLRIIKSRKIIRDLRPKKGWYGWFIATDRRNATISTALELKNEIFRISNSTNEPVYAETTIRRVANFYKKLGFKVYGRIKHPYQGNDIWFVKREPGTT